MSAKRLYTVGIILFVMLAMVAGNALAFNFQGFRKNMNGAGDSGDATVIGEMPNPATESPTFDFPAIPVRGQTPERCSRDWSAPINALAAETFDMTEADVLDALHNGAVLVELAKNTAQVWEFKFKLIERINALIDEAVAAGILPEEIANQLKLTASPAMAEFLAENGGGPYWGKGFLGGKAWGTWRKEATAYLEISVEQLAVAMYNGESLGEITESLGKDVDGLIDVLMADINGTLDTLVEKGILTREQADKIAMYGEFALGYVIYTNGPCSRAWAM